MRSKPQASIVVLVLVCAASYVEASSNADWRTLNHDKGYCAMTGICGRRADGDVLNCPSNAAAATADPTLAAKLQRTCPTLWQESGGTAGRYCCTSEQVDKLASDTGKAVPFILGCPACYHNFLHLWCLLACSADQASFTNISSVQLAPSNNATVVKEVDHWVTDAFASRLYDSCKDVKFGAANLPAMTFIGGGAKDGYEWLDFLGEIKDKRLPPVGSPFQINFRPQNTTPPGIAPQDEALPGCGDPAYTCSCADCPVAPGCSAPPSGPPPTGNVCKVGAMRCWDLALLLLYLGITAAAAAALIHTQWRRHYSRQLQLDDKELAADEPLLDGGESGDVEATADGPSSDVEDATAPEETLPWVERQLQRWYIAHGRRCGRHPWRFLLLGVLLVGCCMVGLTRFRLETDPQRLWVGPTSRAAQEKAAYEASFGPFYRVTQLILSSREDTSGHSAAPGGRRPIVTHDNIELLFRMQAEVDALAAPLPAEPSSPSAPRVARLSDVCYKPFGAECATQSLLQYWAMDRQLYETEQAKSAWRTRLTPDYCFGHWGTQCRAAFGAPVDPHLVLGGFPTDESFRNYSADATAFVVTYPIDSHPENLEAARAWEAAYLQLARTKLTELAHGAQLDISFSAERSVQDELARESYTDAGVVAISYLVMLAYITLALGAVPPRRHWARLFVLSRASLGLAGVAIVAASVAGALGLASAAGVWSTLIIMEVIPFLVLAVGVDNMFVMAHALQQQPSSLPLEERLSRSLGSVGPSITLAATCEALAFGLGGLTPMPAVRNFSLVACLAVLLDFMLQVTVFAACLVLDTRRMEAGRLDCAPCVRLREAAAHGAANDTSTHHTDPEHSYPSLSDPHYPPGPGGGAPSNGEPGLPPPPPPRHEQQQRRRLQDQEACWSLQRALQRYMDSVHIPLLMKPATQLAVLAVFLALLFASLAAIPRLSVGLDQAVALPRDSYLQRYYSDLYAELRVGPPLLVVVEDINVSRAAPDVNKLCSISGCQQDSLMSRIAQAARAPQRTYLASGAASWVDDFLSWLSPSLPKCCRAHAGAATSTAAAQGGGLRIRSYNRPWLVYDGLENDRDGSSNAGGYCPPPDQPPCSGNATACADCNVCLMELPGGRPDTADVQQYLPWFLEAVPSEQCAKGGAGAYNDALQRDSSDPAVVAGLSEGVVRASSFRTYYTPLNKQDDFVNAMGAARRMFDQAAAELDMKIYTYSVFHIFFEQYLDVTRDAGLLIGVPLLAIFLVTWAFTTSLWAASLLLLTLTSLLIDLCGAMYLAGIQVNAVSLVNLAMALGIAVEFCAHILHGYNVSVGGSGDGSSSSSVSRSRRQRAAAALHKMGASVASGITLTKFAGVVVLAFSRTQIFEVYYFRLYLALVLLGAAHGLVLLPVLLALAGPPGPSGKRRRQESPLGSVGS